MSGADICQGLCEAGLRWCYLVGYDETSFIGLVGEVRAWASHFAAENRTPGWIGHYYVWPDELRGIWDQLGDTRGGIIGIVGLQGVGKSSALQAIYRSRIEQEDAQRALDPDAKGPVPVYAYDVLLFKWRRQPELFTSLLNGSHEASESFLSRYLPRLWQLSSRTTHAPRASSPRDLQKLERLLEETRSLMREVAKNPEFYASDAALDEAHRLEEGLEKEAVKRLREAAWMETLQTKEIVLIDTPDYSKSDRRLMAKDLEEIYWLWNTLASSSGIQPNIVLAIQKEMFRGHFFFDKMRTIELRPLRPVRMIESYMRRFKSAEPFNEEALSTVARMSRGIFRRFLRYVLLVIESWEMRPKPRGPIDLQIVGNAVTIERLAEDMELELVELFRKQSDLRLQAVRLLMYLEESGPKKQAELAEEFGLEEYAMSRLLAKLELHEYIARRREGTDKIVSLRNER
jgi:hypothetical protein